MTLLITLLITTSTLLAFMGLRAQRARREALISAAVMGRGAPGTLGLRDIELSKPWAERVLKPTLRRLTGLGRALTPTRNIAHLQRDLILAGLQERMSVADFLGLRFLIGIGLATFFFFLLSLSHLFGSALGVAVAAFLIGLYLPNAILRSRINRRKTEIVRALPNALDMMAISVDAGLGFEAAIQKVAEEWDNELTYEFRRMLSELRVGVSRATALHNLVERTKAPDLASFISVLIQADRLGTPIRKVLYTQAEQMRVRRRQHAQEAAQKAPIKMVFPLVLFIFPATFLVILGPAIPRLVESILY
jgi:tight adherence protein C